VAKSLGLDVPPELGRAKRERKRTVTYNFDDYERKMKVRGGKVSDMVLAEKTGRAACKGQQLCN
jgi:hypothetical protein